MSARGLQITICGARGLRNLDQFPFGVSDPYCTCDASQKHSQIYKTPTVWNSLSPIWNHDITIDEYVPGQAMYFCVWNANKLGADEVLGRAALDGALVDEHGFAGELALELPGGQPAGRLFVAARAVASGEAYSSMSEKLPWQQELFAERGKILEKVSSKIWSFSNLKQVMNSEFCFLEQVPGGRALLKAAFRDVVALYWEHMHADPGLEGKSFRMFLESLHFEMLLRRGERVSNDFRNLKSEPCKYPHRQDTVRHADVFEGLRVLLVSVERLADELEELATTLPRMCNVATTIVFHALVSGRESHRRVEFLRLSQEFSAILLETLNFSAGLWESFKSQNDALHCLHASLHSADAGAEAPGAPAAAGGEGGGFGPLAARWAELLPLFADEVAALELESDNEDRRIPCAKGFLEEFSSVIAILGAIDDLGAAKTLDRVQLRLVAVLQDAGVLREDWVAAAGAAEDTTGEARMLMFELRKLSEERPVQFGIVHFAVTSLYASCGVLCCELRALNECSLQVLRTRHQRFHRLVRELV